MKTQLTKEESQRLLTLGIPKEKASIWNKDKTIFKLNDFLNGEILPLFIEFPNDKYVLSMTGTPVGKYEVYYSGLYYSEFCEEELIDALYQLTCWYYGEYLKQKENGISSTTLF